MDDEAEVLGDEVVQLQNELQHARDELRAKLHMARADTLGAIEAIERDIERVRNLSDETSRYALRAAIARLAHASASLERVSSMPVALDGPPFVCAGPSSMAAAPRGRA